MIEIYHHKYYRKRMANNIHRIEPIVRAEMRKKADDEAQRQLVAALAKQRQTAIPVATVQ